MESFEHIQSAKGPSLFLLSEWMNRHEGLTAGFSGRAGGVSKAPWSSLNLGLHVGDLDEDVIENRQKLTDALDWPFDAWTCAEQVHGNRVYRVTETDRGKGKRTREDAIQGHDAIITNVPGVLLTSFYADCVPLYFYDSEHQALALAHAGWRGTVQRIAAETVLAMQNEFGSNPQRLVAAIGPSISQGCYEVDGTVIDQVNLLISELHLSEEKAETMMKISENGKANINLKEINRQIMIKAGILPIHIEITQWCTGSRRDLFYSHRMEGGLTGRMVSWIGIRER